MHTDDCSALSLQFLLLPQRASPSCFYPLHQWLWGINCPLACDCKSSVIAAIPPASLWDKRRKIMWKLVLTIHITLCEYFHNIVYFDSIQVSWGKYKFRMYCSRLWGNSWSMTVIIQELGQSWGRKDDACVCISLYCVSHLCSLMCF